MFAHLHAAFRAGLYPSLDECARRCAKCVPLMSAGNCATSRSPDAGHLSCSSGSGHSTAAGAAVQGRSLAGRVLGMLGRGTKASSGARNLDAVELLQAVDRLEATAPASSGNIFDDL